MNSTKVTGAVFNKMGSFVVPKLVEVMKHGDGTPESANMQSTLRSNAARTLGNKGSLAFSAVEDLKVACTDDSKTVASAAQQAMKVLAELAETMVKCGGGQEDSCSSDATTSLQEFQNNK